MRISDWSSDVCSSDLLWLSNADLSTYAGRIEDEFGSVHQIILPGEFADYGCAVLGSHCPALTFASVYRTSSIYQLRWNTSWHPPEDEDWMRRVLQAQDYMWIYSNTEAGYWYHTRSPRLSKRTKE